MKISISKLQKIIKEEIENVLKEEEEISDRLETPDKLLSKKKSNRSVEILWRLP